jgi:hypothetical protein
VKRFVKRYFEEYREAFASVLREGIERCEFRRVDAKQVVVTVNSLFEGVTLLWALDPDAVPADEQMEDSVRLLVGGLHSER